MGSVFFMEVRHTDPHFILKVLETQCSKSKTNLFLSSEASSQPGQKAKMTGMPVWHKIVSFISLVAFIYPPTPASDSHWPNSLGWYFLILPSV